jgi:hypothetical protein
VNTTAPSREEFDESIAKHELRIIREDGTYRHIRCAKPNTSDASFDIITWPGYLAFVGDMGDFVFSRAPDMFEFFRNPKGTINPGYWAEKVKSESRFGDGIEVFDVEQFRANVLSDARTTLELGDDAELPPDVLKELGVLLHAEDEWDCISEIRDFSSDRFDFTDYWERENRRYTYHYLWCCYAIVWSINRYDQRNTTPC